MGAQDRTRSFGGGGRRVGRAGKRIKRPRAPWERQEKEPLAYFELFVIYRDMPDRNIDEISRMFGRDRMKLLRQAQRHDWKGRAEAWDAEVDRRMREAELRAVAEMTKRQIGISIGFQKIVASELQALLRRIEIVDREGAKSGGRSHSLLELKDIIKAFEVGAKNERLNRNLPDGISRSEVSGPDGAPVAQVVYHMPEEDPDPK